MFYIMGVFKYFSKFTRKCLCWSLFLIELQADLRGTPRAGVFLEIWLSTFFTWQPQATVSGKSKVGVENCSFNAASTFIWRILKLQKQPPELFYKNRYLRHVTLSKKRLWHRCFPMNFGEIFKNIFLTENLWTTASETHFELAKVRVVFCEKGLWSALCFKSSFSSFNVGLINSKTSHLYSPKRKEYIHINLRSNLW